TVRLPRMPDITLRAKAMGAYLRYKSVLPAKLRGFIILTTARQWTQNYDWAVHAPIALKAGLSPAIVKAVAEGRRPTGMSEEEDIVYEFSTELHHNQSVSDPTYQRVVAKFGEQGVVDMISINGYYTFLAMVLNTERTALPKGSPPTIALFPHASVR